MPPATPFLSWQDGYINGASNTAGVKGYWFTYHDAVGSTIQPASFATAGTNICVFGNTVPFVAGAYGSVVGFSANQLANTDVKGIFDAPAHGVVGFSFTLTGSEVPANLQVNIAVAGSGLTYCSRLTGLTSGGAKTVIFSSTRQDCFSTVPGGPPDVTRIEQVQFQTSSVTNVTTSFNFCFSSIQMLSGN